MFGNGTLSLRKEVCPGAKKLFLISDGNLCAIRVRWIESMAGKAR